MIAGRDSAQGVARHTTVGRSLLYSTEPSRVLKLTALRAQILCLEHVSHTTVQNPWIVYFVQIGCLSKQTHQMFPVSNLVFTVSK